MLAAPAAARAAAVAVMLWTSSRPRASWRANSGDWPRSGRRCDRGPSSSNARTRFRFAIAQHKVRRSPGPDGPGGPAGWSGPGPGSASSCCPPGLGGPVNASSRATVYRQARCLRVRPFPSGGGGACRPIHGAGPVQSHRAAASMVLQGTGFALFLTRQARSAPFAGTAEPVQQEKNPRPAMLRMPCAKSPPADRRARSRRRGSRRPQRRSTGRTRCGRGR